MDVMSKIAEIYLLVSKKERWELLGASAKCRKWIGGLQAMTKVFTFFGGRGDQSVGALYKFISQDWILVPSVRKKVNYQNMDLNADMANMTLVLLTMFHLVSTSI